MTRLLGLVLLFACGTEPEYEIEIVLPPRADTTEAVRLEMDVVRRGCDFVPTDGTAPLESEVVRPFAWAWGEETSVIGNLVPAPYGFTARIRREDCITLLAGCAAQEIEEGGSGLISIEVGPVAGGICLPPTLCEGVEGCVAPE